MGFAEETHCYVVRGSCYATTTTISEALIVQRGEGMLGYLDSDKAEVCDRLFPVEGEDW